MRVRQIGCAMGGPSCVADAGLARQRFMHQEIRQVHQLADRAPPVQPAVIQRGDPGAVIAAIFQPSQRLNQCRRNFMRPEDPYNTAHYSAPLSRFAFLAFRISNILRAIPGLSTCALRASAKAPSGTSRVMTDPDPVMASSPMVTGATSMVFDPMKTFRPISVWCFMTPSKLQVIVPAPTL